MYKLYKGACYYVVVDDVFMAYDNNRWKNMETVAGWQNWLAGDMLAGIQEVNELELLVATGTTREQLTDMTDQLKNDNV